MHPPRVSSWRPFQARSFRQHHKTAIEQRQVRSRSIEIVEIGDGKIIDSCLSQAGYHRLYAARISMDSSVQSSCSALLHRRYLGVSSPQSPRGIRNTRRRNAIQSRCRVNSFAANASASTPVRGAVDSSVKIFASHALNRSSRSRSLLRSYHAVLSVQARSVDDAVLRITCTESMRQQRAQCSSASRPARKQEHGMCLTGALTEHQGSN